MTVSEKDEWAEEIAEDICDDMMDDYLHGMTPRCHGPKIKAALIEAERRGYERGIEDAAKLAKGFSWILPVYESERDNNVSDDVACAVCEQVAEEISRLGGRS